MTIPIDSVYHCDICHKMFYSVKEADTCHRCFDHDTLQHMVDHDTLQHIDELDTEWVDKWIEILADSFRNKHHVKKPKPIIKRTREQAVVDNL